MTTTPTTETSESQKPDSPISDEVADSMKELETKFAKSGITINDDEISVDIAKNTGLRKTGFSEILYEENPIIAARKAAKSRIPKSPLLTRRKSMENCNSLADEETIRRTPAYRSVRQPASMTTATSSAQKSRMHERENTWSGRSSISPTNNIKTRPQITQETFSSPSRTASLTRNTPSRSSHYDSRTRQRSSTRASSVNTSPNKCVNPQSPLAQQLLEAAGKARNDAQILDKIKQILTDYAKKSGDVDDFTTTWVNSNGNFDNEVVARGNSKSPSSKRSSSVSTSSDSNPAPSSLTNVNPATPRRVDKGLSRIPAPIRSNTGLF